MFELERGIQLIKVNRIITLTFRLYCWQLKDYARKIQTPTLVVVLISQNTHPGHRDVVWVLGYHPVVESRCHYAKR